MAMSVYYSTFCGEIVHENRGGVESFYVPDTLGNTAQLWDINGNKTDEWTYWPFGEVRTRTGTTVTPFTFIGTLGYYLDQLANRFYVRARYLRQVLARWQTVDPLWPAEPSYCYAENEPQSTSDPTGLCGLGDSLICSLFCVASTGPDLAFICWFPLPGKCYTIGDVLYCGCRCRASEHYPIST